MKITEALFDRYRRFRAGRGYACDGCGKEVFSYPEDRLCEKCLAAIEKNDGFACEKCGRKAATAGVCLDCKRRLPAFSKGFSPFVYRGDVARLINRLKNGERFLAWFFGEGIAELWKKQALSTDMLLPVPLTEERRRARGYNQAEELAKVISEKTGIVAGEDVLIKIKETLPQKELSSEERAANVAGAYRVKNKEACKGRRVLLVDDVMTTGATGSECARKLYAAGAEEVIFLTAASLPERK